MKYTEALEMRKQARFRYKKWGDAPLSGHAGVFLGNLLGKMRGAKPLESGSAEAREAWNNAISQKTLDTIKWLAAPASVATGLAGAYGVDRLLRLNKWLKEHELMRGMLAGSAGTGIGIAANNFANSMARHAIRTNALFVK